MEVPGLIYIPNVLNKEYSAEVLEYLDTQTWKSLSEMPTSRKVQQYGFEYNYYTKNIKKPAQEIPPIFTPMIDLLKQKVEEAVDEKYSFNQVIVNNYLPGQGISKHVDYKGYGPIIGCYTLNGGTEIIFRKNNEDKSIYVEPNSVYILTGDSRYIWTHEMPARKKDGKIARQRRVSVTFRIVP